MEIQIPYQFPKIPISFPSATVMHRIYLQKLHTQDTSMVPELHMFLISFSVASESFIIATEQYAFEKRNKTQ